MIEITTMGAVLIPLGILAAIMGERWIVALFILVAPWQAGSVLNIRPGDYETGLQPGYWCLALVVLRILIARHEPIPLYQKSDRWLYVFIAYALASAVIMPWIFAGTVRVSSPKAQEFTEAALTPLAWSGSNLTQPAYLVLGVICMLVIRRYARRADNAQVLSRLMVASIAGVCGIAVWEKLAQYGLPFPAEFFRSHPGYYQYLDLGFEGTRRLASVFSEPSFMNVWLVGAVSFLLCRATVQRRLVDYLALGLASTLAVLSYSTTGLLGLVIMLVFTVASLAMRRQLVTASAFVQILAVALILGAITTSILFEPDSPFLRAINRLTVDKFESDSFQERTFKDRIALQNFFDTALLGAGWGSLRASTLLPGLLGGVGIATLAFIAWLWVLRKSWLVGVRGQPAATWSVYYDAFYYNLIGVIVAMSIGVADLYYLSFWICAGMLGAVPPETTGTASADTSVTGGATHTGDPPSNAGPPGPGP